MNLEAKTLPLQEDTPLVQTIQETIITPQLEPKVQIIPEATTIHLPDQRRLTIQVVEPEEAQAEAEEEAECKHPQHSLDYNKNFIRT